MKNLLMGSLVLLAILSCTNSQKNRNNRNGTLNDTLAVTTLLVKEIRKDLESNPAIDSVNEFSNGINRWEIWYRFDKEFWRGQGIRLIFGDINGDGLNDAIADIDFDDGGNRPWKDNTVLYVERTADGYKVKEKLPLFGYRYVQSGSIKDGLIELRGIDWTKDDPMCCPSIKENFKVKLVGETFEVVNENTQQAASDPNAAEFEKAKLVADSIKQKYELLKPGLLKLSNKLTNEGSTSATWNFDSLFRVNYYEEQKHFDENAEIITYEFYNSQGMFLWNLIDKQGYNSNEFIWLKQKKYEKIYDTERNIFNYNIVESDDVKSHSFTDQTAGISKKDFSYDPDSRIYKLTVKKGTEDQFDYFWSELRVDSLLFVHLFGDK
jgi:hypothetical protein